MILEDRGGILLTVDATVGNNLKESHKNSNDVQFAV